MNFKDNTIMDKNTTTPPATFRVVGQWNKEVFASDNPHQVAAFLRAQKSDRRCELDVDVTGGARWLSGDWLDMYNEFKPWLRDEPLAGQVTQ
jgi:hypothetical protein